MSKTETKLTTDYLIVGAGAMGMSFLEELITSSQDIEAIIVDTRAAPGGHWNDAYSFVPLHQPALTYGVNSRTLGDGGPDLASKALILEHYKLALKDLVATGRVKFFPQCKYIGDAKFVSLLDENLKYEVKIKAKLVDATCTMTNVPATTKPNYEVAEGVNLIAINGLSDIHTPWPHYLVIGAGKTGIDAVLHLLDHGVNPDKISWVISNDCWYMERFELTSLLMMGKSMYALVEAITEENVKTCEEALISLENAGILLRLDKNILPTRCRGATVSKEEVEKLGQIRNVIRKGRIEKIETTKIIFESLEEMEMMSKTLYIDCSTNGTLLPPPKKVFDGNIINVQWIMFPPPSMSANIIAAMELRFPEDEEKKNHVCQVFTLPQMSNSILACFYKNQVNSKSATEELGMIFQMRRRVFALHHITYLDLIKLIYYMSRKEDKFLKKLQLLMQENEDFYY